MLIFRVNLLGARIHFHCFAKTKQDLNCRHGFNDLDCRVESCSCVLEGERELSLDGLRPFRARDLASRLISGSSRGGCDIVGRVMTAADAALLLPRRGCRVTRRAVQQRRRGVDGGVGCGGGYACVRSTPTGECLCLCVEGRVGADCRSSSSSGLTVPVS